jgi:uncharacterized membrane protein
MSHHSTTTGVCAVTGKTMPVSRLIPVGALRPAICERLLRLHPDLTAQAMVSDEPVNDARLDYVRTVLASQLGELSHLDEEVLESLHKHELLSSRSLAGPDVDRAARLGDRVADKIASFGGSWRFIIGFGIFLLVWVLTNIWVLTSHPFDPYPFILLNLILSCIAALQAPVIMMSQNRQEARDRQRAENDYKINLKAELEIRHLHEKMDYLLHHFATRLMEVQQIQLDLMRELAQRRTSS